LITGQIATTETAATMAIAFTQISNTCLILVRWIVQLYRIKTANGQSVKETDYDEVHRMK